MTNTIFPTDISSTHLASVHGGYSDVVDNRRDFHRWEFGRRLPFVNAAIQKKGCTTADGAPPASQAGQ